MDRQRKLSCRQSRFPIPLAKPSAPRNVCLTFPEGCDLFVLDIDGVDGRRALEALEEEYGPLPNTRKSIAGSGGLHLIFRAEGVDIRNTASAIAIGVDIRGANGQIVAPPSIHPSGNFYRWEDDCAPWGCDVADAPEWLRKSSFEATKGRGDDLKWSKRKAKTRGSQKTSNKDAGSHADACARVEDAKTDIERQLAEREADRLNDPVSEARADARDVNAPPHVLDPIYDDNLVDAEGFLFKSDDAPELYRAVGINPKDDNAYKLLQLEIRDQMYGALNERFSYVVLDGEAKLAPRQPQGEAIKLRKKTTLADYYLNRAVSYWDERGDKPKVAQIKPSDVFLRARKRETYDGTCFEPDSGKAKAAARRRAYNLWNGFAVPPLPGDWSLLRGHIKENICGGDDDIFNFFMTWLASLFARLGAKVPSSLAIIGEQGTGKSKLFDWMRKAIGASALKVSAGRHLTGNFNAHLDGLILLVCEEAFWAGDKSAAGVMKDLISSDTLQIEGKFENVVERANYVNIVFISNNKWSVPVPNVGKGGPLN